MEGTDRARWWWGGLRAVVIGCWLAVVAAGWWTAPRPATYEQARADIAGHRIVAFQWGDRWDDGGARRVFSGDTLISSGTLGPLFAWRTGDGRVHWVDTTAHDEDTVIGAEDEQAYSGPGTATLARDIETVGAGQRFGSVIVLNGLAGGVELFLKLVFLGTLWLGRQPVLGTKWYWFWLIVCVPYHLGLIYWTLRDRPWTARRPEPDGRRGTWFHGLFGGIALSVLIPIALELLRWPLGTFWIPG